MVIYSESRQSFIELTVVAAETLYYPSINIAVTIHDDSFSGTLASAWIDNNDLDRFNSEMVSIDTKRNGKARLQSMSPDAFILEFEVFDKSGHIKLQYSLSKIIGSSAYIKNSLTGGYVIDTSEFSHIVSCFKELSPK